jgi:DNA-binding transcriptional LysR family regulator
MRSVHLPSVDLNLLVALEALLETLSVTGAAKRLHVSQPAMSRTLGRLRELFDDPLLLKQGRQMVATDRALALKQPLRLLLSDTRLLLTAPSPFDEKSSTHHFRLATSDYAQVVLLGQVAQTLAAKAPAVTLSVIAIEATAFEALAKGNLDLVMAPPDLAPGWCEHEPLLRDPWVCVRHEALPLPSTLRRYLALPHIRVTTEHGFGGPVDAALAARGKARSVRLSVSDFAGALFVAAQSELLATVPAPVGKNGARLLDLHCKKVPFALTSPTISMIWPRRASNDPAHIWLRETVRQALNRVR